jgi:hypothetical protein
MRPPRRAHPQRTPHAPPGLRPLGGRIGIRVSAMFLPCPTRRKELAMSIADQLGLTQVVRNTTRRCPAHMDGLVDRGPLDLFVHAVSLAERRWCPQGCHRDIQSLGHGRQVVDRPPRLTPKPHGQRRLTQTHFGRKALLADTSARHPSAHLRGHSQTQLIQCALPPRLDDRRSAPPWHAPGARIKCALHGIPSRTYPQPTISSLDPSIPVAFHDLHPHCTTQHDRP